MERTFGEEPTQAYKLYKKYKYRYLFIKIGIQSMNNVEHYKLF